MADWQDAFQGWVSSALDGYSKIEQAKQQADATYESERLRLLARNPYGQPYYEGQPVSAQGLGMGAMSPGTKTAIAIGVGALVLMFALSKG